MRKRKQTLGEATAFAAKVLDRLTLLREQDDGSNPKRSQRLKVAYDRIDNLLDALCAVYEMD